jgi:diguanylate cyclase (GGDEF)-like protein
MPEPELEDVRSTDPVERLLEDSWGSRVRVADGREWLVESVAATSFLVAAVALFDLAPSVRAFDPVLALTLLGLYAFTSRIIKFPIGAGYVVPSSLVLVPMLLVLPPAAVPLLVAGGMVLGALGELIARRTRPELLFFSIADAWHSIGPAFVLAVFGPGRGTPGLVALYIAAFAAGCVVDLVTATMREAAAAGVAPRLQVRVILVVWLIDACIAPLGVLIALAVARYSATVVLLIPFTAVMLLFSRERSARIERAQQHMEILARERSRLQNAVQCLGDAFAAKLDLPALAGTVLRGSIEALDADAGRVTLRGSLEPVRIELGAGAHAALLSCAEGAARSSDEPRQLQQDGTWALGVPFSLAGESAGAMGALAVSRADRSFRQDELTVLLGLVERARQAAVEIIGHEKLRVQALTDPLTRLGNRRKLALDFEQRRAGAESVSPLSLALLDLDGFKGYNDTFGHGAGDDLLAQVADRLTAALAGDGAAYRLGGDEFCVVSSDAPEDLEATLALALAAVRAQTVGNGVGASYGAVLIPHEASELADALRIADQRMYARKRHRGAEGQGGPAAAPTAAAAPSDLSETS